VEKAAGDPQGLFEPELALKLARRLLYSGRPPESAASAAFLRKKRIQIGSHLWRLALDNAYGRVATATLFPRGKSMKPEQLRKFSPQQFLRQLRSSLDRLGAANAGGYLIATVHGEYEPEKGLFYPHFHLLAAGGMIDVVGKLRSTKTYRSDRRAFHEGSDDCFQRVRVSQGELTNLPSPLTYLYQSFWPSRWTGTLPDGHRVRRRDKGRMPEPYHTLVLLWLDKWRLRHLTLLMNIEVRASGLFVKK
jgi:hypothetical protein